MKILCNSSGGAQEKKKDRMKLSLPLKLVIKLVVKLVRVPVILICKIFIPSYTFDDLFCRNWPFSPPICETLWITLVNKSFV